MGIDSPFVSLDWDHDLLAQALLLEYRIIIHYPTLLALLPDEESRTILVALGTDSIRHADAVANVIRSMGKEPPFPIFEPRPDLTLRQTFEKQLEYERLALALHNRAAEVAAPQHRSLLRRIARQEERHIMGVEQILARLK